MAALFSRSLSTALYAVHYRPGRVDTLLRQAGLSQAGRADETDPLELPDLGKSSFSPVCDKLAALSRSAVRSEACEVVARRGLTACWGRRRGPRRRQEHDTEVIT